MDSTDFYFNGQRSSDLGIYLVKLNTGFIKDPFLGQRDIISEQIVGNPIPYVYDKSTKPLQVEMVLSCLEGYWTTEKRREIARWLDTDNFEEFYSADDINKKYYLMYQNGIDIETNGLQQGYITVSFLNISPFTYSPIYQKEYDLSTISSPTTISFTNDGDNDLKPEMWILKYGTGNVSIKNLSDGGREFLIQNLADQETVYFDNRDRHIETDLPLTYRFDDFNGVYLNLKRGVNNLEITGACKISFRYQFETKG